MFPEPVKPARRLAPTGNAPSGGIDDPPDLPPEFRVTKRFCLALIYRDKHTSGTQLEVLSGNLCIAAVYKATLSVVANQAVQWRWTFYVTASPAGFEYHGVADTLEEAKARVEKSWRACWRPPASLKPRRRTRKRPGSGE